MNYFSPYFLVFVYLYIISFVMVINCDNWFLIWLGMEVNMISFLFLIYCRSSMISMESCLKYFFVQSIGSALFMSFFYLNKVMFMYMSSMVLVMKMGGGMFYFWFPSICMGISWFSCFMLMIFQKIIPLMLLNFFGSEILWLMIIISLVVGVLGSFNQMNMKMLMAFSSIHHIGWMIMCVFVDFNLWFMYLFMYMIVIFPLLLIFNNYEINNLMMVNKVDMKWLLIFLMMNMGGLPPFLGFFLKWISFYYILNLNLIMVFLLIMLSSLMFYIYIRICFNVLLGMNIVVFFQSFYKNFYINIESVLLIGVLFGNFLIMNLFI